MARKPPLLQDVYRDQRPIDRTFINTWEDPKVVDIVKKSGRKQLIIAALRTEVCLAMPVIHALGEGYDVFAVTDASGGVSAESPRHERRSEVDARYEVKAPAESRSAPWQTVPYFPSRVASPIAPRDTGKARSPG